MVVQIEHDRSTKTPNALRSAKPGMPVVTRETTQVCPCCGEHTARWYGLRVPGESQPWMRCAECGQSRPINEWEPG